MSDCQELVYSGFVPVPDDIEELGMITNNSCIPDTDMIDFLETFLKQF